MAKKKLAFEVPTGETAVDTLVVGGSTALGFLGGRLVRNKVPQANGKVAKVLIALGALGVHASIEGNGHDANALRGVTLGLGINQIAALADDAGALVMAKRDEGIVQGASVTLNGALDYAAAMLTDNYIPAGGRSAGPVAEDVQVFLEDKGPNGGEDYFPDYALNNQHEAQPGLQLI